MVVGNQRFFLPRSVGIERRMPAGISLGGSAVALVGGAACETGTDVRLGGAATVGMRLPLAYAFSIEGLGRLGTTVSTAIEDTPELLYDLALGLGIGFESGLSGPATLPAPDTAAPGRSVRCAPATPLPQGRSPGRA